jgi:hypothetical protein
MALSLQHLQGIFIFYFVAMALSILTFTYEYTCRPIYKACKVTRDKRAVRKELKKFFFLN